MLRRLLQLGVNTLSKFRYQQPALEKQLEEKDKQIAKLQEGLSQASERSDTIILQLTRQLEQQQLMLGTQ